MNLISSHPFWSVNNGLSADEANHLQLKRNNSDAHGHESNPLSGQGNSFWAWTKRGGITLIRGYWHKPDVWKDVQDS